MITARGQGSTGYRPVRALFEKLPGILFISIYNHNNHNKADDQLDLELSLNNKQAAKTLPAI